ncbi:MAG TPA: hypothetical protein VFY13_09640, partial [Luteolibacter sp.]|nr:hypothetical protein [Luteolibacter sp.]
MSPPHIIRLIVARWFIGLCAGGLLVACGWIQTAAAQPQGEVWIPLFNGRDLEGWTPKFSGLPVGENPHRIFRVEDGLLKVSYAE